MEKQSVENQSGVVVVRPPVIADGLEDEFAEVAIPEIKGDDDLLNPNAGEEDRPLTPLPLEIGIQTEFGPAEVRLPPSSPMPMPMPMPATRSSAQMNPVIQATRETQVMTMTEFRPLKKNYNLFVSAAFFSLYFCFATQL